MKRTLESRAFISAILAMAIGTFLFYTHPFPDEQIFLRVIAVRAPQAFLSFKYRYCRLLFTTPYLVCSTVLSGLYIFTLKARQSISPGRLPKYPDPSKRDDLFLVVGEVHNPRKPVPAKAPSWLTIPERGLFTGIAILGAIGSGKTSCCMLPFAEQILAYKPAAKGRRIGGLILEVKGDFCSKVKDILERHQRAEDYIEISLDSEYCYNPLHNDLDAYALAYNIASLLNNLFGRGKEPFWQQAYTNLVKFIILLHKVNYDYVTLFDVYECAINPDKLELKSKEGERLFQTKEYVLVPDGEYIARRELVKFGFDRDTSTGEMKAAISVELLRHLDQNHIPYSMVTETGGDAVAATANLARKREQLEAVQRWFFHDWRRIEPKLRTSIVEGISVFLSLFDDNPAVKRTFCPPAECYDPDANADFKFGRPLPSLAWLIENGRLCCLNFPIAMNAGLAKALGVMLKLDFQRAVLNRVP